MKIISDSLLSGTKGYLVLSLSLRSQKYRLSVGKADYEAMRALDKIAAGFANKHTGSRNFLDEVCPLHHAVWNFTAEEMDSFWSV